MNVTSSGAPRGNHTLDILVVEDDLLTLELMKTALEAEGATVTAIDAPLEAVRLAEAHQFDGIFLDLEMPDINGLETARRIRAGVNNRQTPIVFVTARQDHDTMKQTFAAGGKLLPR